AIFVVVVGALAGLYPSFFLASFKPAQVLKGKLRAGFRSSKLRNGLVLLQFVISITLITCTLVVQKQLNFMRSRELGFDKENVICIDNAHELPSQEAFINSLKQMPGIQLVGASTFRPIDDYDGTAVVTEEDKENRKLVNFTNADYDYLDAAGFKLVAGRNFSRDISADSDAVILNETAARFLFEGDALNKKVYYSGEHTVVGIIKDFNFESLKSEIKPLAIFLRSNQRFLSVRLAPGDYRSTIASIQNLWKQQQTSVPFSYTFLDENYNDLFQEESKLSTIFGLFTALALFIACLGLLGLAAYMADRRSKEISVRKVLGATVSQIVVLLSTDFVKIILVAFIVAAPLAYIIMKQWLDGFAFKTELSLWILSVGGLVVLATALLAVSYQSIRAALINPVKSLKEE
ncbi:MAG: ABC transporter permease, partial [Bacteroidota bacterium]